MRAALIAIALVAALAPGCGDVVPTVRSTLPTNTCPEHSCDAYGASLVKPECTTANRCEVKSATSFVLLVNVPNSAYLASGSAFLIDSKSVDTAMDLPRCNHATCIALPPLVGITVEIVISPSLRARYGLTASNDTIPCRVEFTPQVPTGLDPSVVQTIIATTSRNADGRAHYHVQLPPGFYTLRYMPEPPYDNVPPIERVVQVKGSGELPPTIEEIGSSAFPLDSIDVTRRTSHVTRTAGLAGFRVWLEDATTKRRISALGMVPAASSPAAPLVTAADFLLDTLGQNDNSGTLRANVNIVVAPPDGMGLPTIESPITNEFGFTQAYPEVPDSIVLRGTVQGSPGSPERIAGAQISFRSTKLERLMPDASVDYLTMTRYVTADRDGAYAVTLPRGSYDIDVDPGSLSKYVPSRTRIEVTADSSLLLFGREASDVKGTLVIGDGRPFPGTEVVFQPIASALGRAVPIHPRVFVTDTTGSFAGAVGSGQYDVTFRVPSWTGFPRVLIPSHAVVDANNAGLDASVGVPGVIGYALYDQTGSNAVGHAVVRAFALTKSGDRYIEMGTTVTDESGRFEVLVPSSMP